MGKNPKPDSRKLLLWPSAALAIGALVVVNPYYAPRLSLEAGVAAWFADLTLVLILLAHPFAARIGILLAGIFCAVPCFLWAPALARGLLMCGMAFSLVIAVSSLFVPPTANFQTRLAFFFSWMGTQKIGHRTRSFDLASLLRLTVATAVFAAFLAAVKTVSPAGYGWLMRWLAGGSLIFAFAEMATAAQDFTTALMGITAPALMRSPFLSASVVEFWTKRWNVAASALAFRPMFFTPLARHGVTQALFAAFFASALAHLLLAFMATGRWEISFMWGAFFLLQPLLILTERKMHVRHWSTAAARAWTLTALAITSPLFVEPMIQIVSPSWSAPETLLLPTIATLGFVMAVNVFFAFGQFTFCRPRR